MAYILLLLVYVKCIAFPPLPNFNAVSPICDASRVVECPGSDIRLWIYEPEVGNCRQVEVCPFTGASSVQFRLPLEMANGVFNLWSGIGDGGGSHSSINSPLLPGTFASSSACYSNCLPPTPSGTDVTSTYMFYLLVL